MGNQFSNVRVVRTCILRCTLVVRHIYESPHACVSNELDQADEPERENGREKCVPYFVGWISSCISDSGKEALLKKGKEEKYIEDKKPSTKRHP